MGKPKRHQGRPAICRHFIHYGCQLGNACKFRHVMTCRVYAKYGRCAYGRRCRYIHEVPPKQCPSQGCTHWTRYFYCKTCWDALPLRLCANNKCEEMSKFDICHRCFAGFIPCLAAQCVNRSRDGYCSECTKPSPLPVHTETGAPHVESNDKPGAPTETLSDNKTEL